MNESNKEQVRMEIYYFPLLATVTIQHRTERRKKPNSYETEEIKYIHVRYMLVDYNLDCGDFYDFRENELEENESVLNIDAAPLESYLIACSYFLEDKCIGSQSLGILWPTKLQEKLCWEEKAKEYLDFIFNTYCEKQEEEK